MDRFQEPVSKEEVKATQRVTITRNIQKKKNTNRAVTVWQDWSKSRFPTVPAKCSAHIYMLAFSPDQLDYWRCSRPGARMGNHIHPTPLISWFVGFYAMWETINLLKLTDFSFTDWIWSHLEFTGFLDICFFIFICCTSFQNHWNIWVKALHHDENLVVWDLKASPITLIESALLNWNIRWIWSRIFISCFMHEVNMVLDIHLVFCGQVCNRLNFIHLAVPLICMVQHT